MAIDSEYGDDEVAMQYQQLYVNSLVTKLSLSEGKTHVNVLGYGVGSVLTAVVPATSTFDPAAITADFAEAEAYSTSAIQSAVSSFSGETPTGGTSGAGVLRVLNTYGTHMRDTGGGLIVLGSGTASKEEYKDITAARKTMPTVPILCIFPGDGEPTTALFEMTDDDGNLCDILLTRQTTDMNIDNSVGIALGLFCPQDADKKPADPCDGNGINACQNVRRNYRGESMDDPRVIASGATYRYDTQCYYNSKVKCAVKIKYQHIYGPPDN